MTKYQNIYFSDNIRFKRRIYRRFMNKKIVPGIYVIREAYEPDQLEIIKADYFKQDMLRDASLSIVGFASGYDDAVLMVTELLDLAISATGEPDIKLYLNNDN